MLSGFYFCTLKMEAVGRSKTFIIVYQAAWCDVTVMKHSFDIRKADQPDETFEFDFYDSFGLK
jgi:hypothetical protein